jgi:hypothetical protein
MKGSISWIWHNLQRKIMTYLAFDGTKPFFIFYFKRNVYFLKKNEHVDSKLDRSSFAQLTCVLIIEDPVKTWHIFLISCLVPLDKASTVIGLLVQVCT